jgi:dienelactone hydrolase
MNPLTTLLAGLALALPAAAGTPWPYRVGELECEGHRAGPTGAPLVLLVHDWDGLTDYEMRRADMLADAGFAVLALDLFGAGVRPVELEEKRRLTGALYSDRAELRRRLDGALAAAAAAGLDTSRAVAAGYCFGGSAVLEWARSGAPLDGFVSFHGGLETPEGQDWSGVEAPLLVLHGSADTLVPPRQVADLLTRLEAAAVPHEVICYGGAPHAFTVFGSPAYRAEADQASWERFLGFLAHPPR